MATPQLLNLSIQALGPRYQQIARLTFGLIAGRTRARWRLTATREADLVLVEAGADPASALPLGRLGASQPMLLALVSRGGTVPGHLRAISAPLRVDAFVRVLDEIAAELSDRWGVPAQAPVRAQPHSSRRIQTPTKPQPPCRRQPQDLPAPRRAALASPAGPGAAAGQGPAGPSAPARAGFADPPENFVRLGPPTPLVSALRRVMGARDAGAWRIDIGATTVVVLPSEQTWFTRKPVALASIATLSRLEHDAQASPLAPGDALLTDAPARRQPLHQLLWSCGLAAPSDRLLPWLPERARVRLQAWPAVLRGHAVPAHTGFAALLLQGEHTIAELAAQTGRTAAEARAFVNACALCGLIDAGQAPDPGPARRSRKAPPTKVVWHGARRARRASPRLSPLAKARVQPLAGQRLPRPLLGLPVSQLRLGAIGPLTGRAPGRA